MLRPTLASLTVTKLRDPQPAATWLELLKGLPQLVELRLTDAVELLDVLPIAVPAPVEAATLNKLKSITLGDHGSGITCANLLNCISFPKSAETELYADVPGDEDELVFVVAAIADKGRVCSGVIGQPLPARALSVDTWRLDMGTSVTIYTQVNASATCGEIDAQEGEDLDSLPISAILRLPTSPDDVLQAFVALHPINEVRSFRALSVSLCEDTWSVLARELPNLRELEAGVAEETAMSLFRHLRLHPFSFPTVSRLRIPCIRWHEQHIGQYRHWARSGCLLSPLIKAAKVRKRSGLPINFLELPYCVNLDDEGKCEVHLRRLRKPVGVFQYDIGEMEDPCDSCQSSDDESDDDDEIDHEPGGER